MGQQPCGNNLFLKRTDHIKLWWEIVVREKFKENGQQECKFLEKPLHGGVRDRHKATSRRNEL